MALRISQSQLEVFEETALRDFEARVVQHVRQHFPKSFEVLGETRVLGIARGAVERAREHGLTTERSVVTYLNLMLMLGSGFDTDPQLPWAAEILGDGRIDEAGKSDALYDKALDYFEQVAGPGGVNAAEALGRIQRESADDLPTALGPEFYSRLLARLRAVYPEKCDYVGELGLRRMIQRGIEQARHYRITGGRGVAVYVGLMFMLGSGFDEDPQMPWAAEVLNDAGDGGEAGKAERLRAAALESLAQMTT